MNYRIEYSESQNAFHCEFEDKINPREENTHGWQTIAKNVPSPIESVFCRVMEKCYGVGLKDGEKIQKVSSTILKSEYKVFVQYLKSLSTHNLLSKQISI